MTRGGVLPGMMHHHDGKIELALEFSEVREKPGDFTYEVFIQAVDPQGEA
jgi:hypothetical protein